MFSCCTRLHPNSSAIFTMTDKFEQRICIKFCVKLGKSATETFKMLRQAFGEHSSSRTQVFEWHARFKAGRASVMDDERSGRPVTSKTPENVAKIHKLICEDRRRTIHQISHMIGISYGACQEILTEKLNIHRVAAKFVPLLLTLDQKQQRFDMCLELHEKVNKDPTFISRIITCNESWIYSSDPKRKHQWKSPQLPRPKKRWQVRNAMKIMLVVFIDVKGIIHYEFVPPGRTMNSDSYINVLRHLREKVQQTRPELWQNCDWLLHHDNSSAHTSLKTTQFLTENNMTVILHPPYSPDLSPCDFALFPKMKLKLKSHYFETIDQIQMESQAILDSLQEDDFQNAFKSWKRRWEHCISSKGDYFEVDSGHI